MNIRLHKNATTTPARRRYIQTSPLSVVRLAAKLGVSEDTIRRWRGRDCVEDCPHTAHRLQTMVVRKFIHEGMSRSAYRVLGKVCTTVASGRSARHTERSDRDITMS